MSASVPGPLEGAVAVVTGAGAGLGLAIAEALLAQGAQVVGGDLEPAALAALAPAGRVLAQRIDVRDADAGDELAAAALERFGRIDVLVNNAGTMPQREGGFLSVADDAWRATWETNFLGYVRMARAVLPHMVQRGAGALVHMASIRATTPSHTQPDYSVSKASIVSLNQCLAREFGPAGIRSNAVSPGPVRTSAWERPGGVAETIARRHGMDVEAALEHEFKVVRRIPLGRAGTAEEVAAVVAFLASPLASNVTGANVVVDGGSTVPAA